MRCDAHRRSRRKNRKRPHARQDVRVRDRGAGSGGHTGRARRARTPSLPPSRVLHARRRGGDGRAGQGGPRDHDGIAAPRVLREPVAWLAARPCAREGSAVFVDIAVKSGHASVVRPSVSVCSFLHASYSCEWRAAATAATADEEDDRRPGSCHWRHAPTLARSLARKQPLALSRIRVARRGRDRDRCRPLGVIYDHKRRKRDGNVVRPSASLRPSAVGSQQWHRMRSELRIE